MVRLCDYQTIVFDCDGVILDSNGVKTEAFRIAASHWGAEAAEALVLHHKENGGISRYAKFQHFLAAIAPRFASDNEGPGMDELLFEFGSSVRRGLEACSVAAGLHLLREQLLPSRWLVVSGGDQAELRDIFERRKLAKLFNGGIFGSPDEKKMILAREIASGNIHLPAVYLGDSIYDYHCAVESKLDFVFVSAWSEVADWRSFVTHNDVPFVNCLSDFVQT